MAHVAEVASRHTDPNGTVRIPQVTEAFRARRH